MRNTYVRSLDKKYKKLFIESYRDHTNQEKIQNSSPFFYVTAFWAKEKIKGYKNRLIPLQSQFHR